MEKFYFLVAMVMIGGVTGEDDDDFEFMTEPTEPYSHTIRNLECVEVVKQDGDLTFVQRDEAEPICGVFLVGDIDDVINVEIVDARLACGDGEFIELFDGWMTKGEIIPSVGDHLVPVEGRTLDFCSWRQENGHKRSLSFTSTQNVALVQYRFLRNNGLTIRFKRSHDPTPRCHVVTPASTGEYTMRSVGGRNCTFSMFQPSHLVIREINLGNPEVNSTGDTIEILKGESLNPRELSVVHKFSAPFSSKELKTFALDRSHAAVRMTSSGAHDNVIKFWYTRITEETVQGEVCT